MSKALSVRVMALLAALPLILLTQSATALKGAEATFPQPIYAKWFGSYQRQHPAVEISYEALGSEADIRRMLAGSVDFGASDSPEILHEIAPAVEDKYLFLPSVIGAVVPIVNLPGLPSDVNFTPEALVGIYLGKIKKWNDPLLKSANRGLPLPDLEIVVVHRADGSGTSHAWTDYLSKTNSGWRDQIGSGLMPKWPIDRAATGNDGVAKLVKEIGGSIGYVEFIYALQNRLSIGKVRNQKGRFLAADLESVTAAASVSAPDSNLKISLVNAPAADAYPIASFTWFIVPAHIESDTKRQAMKDFLAWMLGPGQKQVAALGYVALPPAIANAERTIIANMK